jgi:integrase
MDPDAIEVAPATQYLRELTLTDMSTGTVRAYAHGLLRWFRVLWAVDVAWDRAGRSEVDVLVGSLRQGENPQRRRSAASVSTAGMVNVKTGKQVLPLGYAPSGINHTLTVVRCFYSFHLGCGRGPLVNPVPGNPDRAAALRHRAPDTPMLPFRRGPLRQKEPHLLPRAMSDQAWDEFLAGMGCDRDRAIVLMAVSSGARASELLGIKLADIDWPGLRFYVVSKGSRARQAVPASPEAFRMLARYLQSRGPTQPTDEVWQTLRGRARPLTYSAMRRVFQRVNDRLGTNWTAHDLRHTAATRMANDPAMTLVDTQSVLRHAQLATTGRYLRTDQDVLFDKVQEVLSRPRPQPTLATGYDAGDMKAVFGG